MVNFSPNRENYMKSKNRHSIILGLVFGLTCGFTAYLLRRKGIFIEILNNYVPIRGDVYDDGHNGRFVYFTTNSTKYPILTDPDFQIRKQAGRLRRQTQYCQWQETKICHDETDADGIQHSDCKYYYHKGWVPYQVNSLFFHNPIYHNPTVDDVPDMLFRDDFVAGKYIIDRSMGVSGSFYRVAPDNQQINEFMRNSYYSRTFRYAGRGIFYREYQRGFLEQVIHVATFFDLSNADHFDWCKPGDTRTWFEAWSPDSVSVLGNKTANKIYLSEFQGFPIGNAGAGLRTPHQLIQANASWFPTIITIGLHLFIIGFIIYDLYKHHFTLYYISFYLIAFSLSCVPSIYEQLTSYTIQILYALTLAVIAFLIDHLTIGNQPHEKVHYY